MYKNNAKLFIDEVNVVLNFHQKDQHSAKSIMKLLMAVEEGRSCKYYLQYGDDESTIAIGDIISKFIQCKNAEFSKKLPDVKIPDDFIYNDPNTFTYIGNHAARSREQKNAILQWNLCLFKYIQKLDDFLIIEPDCVILANNWIKNIYIEYQKYDYPIFGHLKKGKIKGSSVPTHWAGCSIYNGRELRKLPLFKYFSNRYDNPWWPYRNEIETTNANNAFYGPIFSGYDISYDYFLFALYWKEKTGSNNPADWPLENLVDRSDLIFCDFRSTLTPDAIMSRFAGKLPMMHGVKDDEIRNRMIDYFAQEGVKKKVEPLCHVSKVLANQSYSDASNDSEIDEDNIVAISNSKLVVYKNRHKGHRCVIIGNGPSLNKMDLSFLENEITFGTNRIYLLFNRWKFRPTYYVSVNPLVLEQSATEILKIMAPKFLSSKGIMFFANPPEDLMFIRSLPKWYFSCDPREGLCEGWTVTYFAMQLAYFMGFSEVILIGVDHHFVTQGDPNKEVVSQGADPNHFHPDYFGKGIRWHLPDLKRSEGSYAMAKKAFEEEGRRIIDATVDGKLTIFPKVDYRKYFSEKNVAKVSEVSSSTTALRVLEQAQELTNRGQINAAINLVHKTCRSMPNNASLHFALGLLLEKRGDKRVAVSYFESAVKLGPENMNYLKKLAFCYHKTCRRSGEALILLQKVLEVDTKDYNTYQAVAQICQSVGRAEDAAYFNAIAQQLSNSVALSN